MLLSAIKDYVAPLSSPIFSMKLIFYRALVFACLDKLMPMIYNKFGDMKILISYLLYNHRFLAFRQVFYTLLAGQRNGLLLINSLKYLIFTSAM